MGSAAGPALNSSNQKASSNFAKISYDGLFNENYFEIKSKETSVPRYFSLFLFLISLKHTKQLVKESADSF